MEASAAVDAPAALDALTGASLPGEDRRQALSGYVCLMAPRTRLLAFGSAGLLVVAGALCAALVGGAAGEVLTIVLLSAGLGGALLLVFLEIGLGEERELADEEARRREGERRRLGLVRGSRLRGGLQHRPRRPG